MVLITADSKKWKRGRVHPVSVERRLYLVESSEKGTWYPVRLRVSETGLPLGECGCRMGQLDKCCRHVRAAAVVASGIRRMRRAAEGRAR
jgi:hypothetical protein